MESSAKASDVKNYTTAGYPACSFMNEVSSVASFAVCYEAVRSDSD